MRIAAALCLLSSLSLASPADAKDAKLSVEELVAKHLESIGPAEARAALHARIGEGVVALRILLGGTAQLAGRALLYSEPGSERINLRVDDPNYSGESFSLVGGKVDVGFFQPGRRSPLADFIAAYDDPLREGLLTGVLSLDWPLSDPGLKGAKLKYDGLKKVDGRLLHQLSYQPKKNRHDMKIQLFLDPESLRHVRTTYARSVPAPLSGDISQSSQQQDTHLNLEESFGGFQAVDGLTLPTQWTLRFSSDQASASSLWRFEVTLQKFRTNPATGEAP